jgi:hypothetical protein
LIGLNNRDDEAPLNLLLTNFIINGPISLSTYSVGTISSLIWRDSLHELSQSDRIKIFVGKLERRMPRRRPRCRREDNFETDLGVVRCKNGVHVDRQGQGSTC